MMQDSARWISTFLEAQAAELGAATNTLLAYGRDLKDFADWLEGRGDFDTASRDDVEAYLIHCDAQGLAKSTRARRLSAIRQLYRFAFEEGWRTDNPAIQITGPGRDQRLPKILSIEEVDRLLAAAREMGGRRDDRVRNTCLMELLYATGMRVSELVSLPVSAARGDPRMLLIMGKGGKERMVPLSPPARAALSVWLDLRDAAQEAGRAGGKPLSKYLFPSTGRLGHLTRHRFYLLIKDMAVQAGISPDQGHAAYPAPCLCHASAGQWRRSARDPDPAGPCRCGNNGNLHPCSGRTPDRAGDGASPPRAGLSGEILPLPLD